MTFSMKDGPSSDNYPDKSSRRVRHGKGGCTSKRKKGGCVARTPVSTSPAARLLCTARCTLSSSTLHALSFGGGDTPGIEVLSRQGFRQDASPRGVSLTSASFAAMWLNVIALSAKTTNRNLMDFLSALKKISHYRSCIINAMWWWQTFHELRYLVLKCHIWTSLYIKDTWHWSWCLMSCCFQ